MPAYVWSVVIVVVAMALAFTALGIGFWFNFDKAQTTAQVVVTVLLMFAFAFLAISGGLILGNAPTYDNDYKHAAAKYTVALSSSKQYTKEWCKQSKNRATAFATIYAYHHPPRQPQKMPRYEKPWTAGWWYQLRTDPQFENTTDKYSETIAANRRNFKQLRHFNCKNLCNTVRN